MKKSVVLFVFIMISSITQAQLLFKNTLRFGYADISMQHHSVVVSTPKNTFMGFLGTRMSYKQFNIFTNIETLFTKFNDTKEFAPMLVDYKIGASYTFGMFSIQYEHLCSHSIVNRGAYFQISGGYDKLYLEINF